MTSQPRAENSQPEDAELTAMVMKIAMSLAPCTLARSAGVWVSVSSVVPPRYMKFQPTPTSTSAAQKCMTSTPESAMATQPRLSSTPVKRTVRTPKLLISAPVKNDGANIAMTCHWITNAASLNGCEQDCIASGVAV